MRGVRGAGGHLPSLNAIVAVKYLAHHHQHATAESKSKSRRFKKETETWPGRTIIAHLTVQTSMVLTKFPPPSSSLLFN